MRRLTRRSKVVNGLLALPLLGFGVLAVAAGEWGAAFACFGLALFLFWILPTITGNLKASLQEKVTEVASSISESKRANRASTFSSQTVDDDPAAPSGVDSSRAAAAVSWLCGLGKTQKRIVLGVCAAVLVLLLVGPAVTNSVRVAWDEYCQRNYARGEAEYLARLEAQEDALPTSAPSQDAYQSDGSTPNGHSRWMQLPDIVAMAPADGSVCRAAVVYTAAGGDAGCFILEIDDTELGGADSTYVHDVQLFEGDMGECYINGELVSLDDFYSFIGSETAETKGSIEFTCDAIVRSNAYSELYVPNDGH